MANTVGLTTTEEHIPKWRYDVFLCFRGEDTRHSFTGNLYNALTKNRLKTFMDHEGLKTGEHIRTIHEALEQSRIAIVVLSKCFASSSYCLDEIVNILDCKHQLVLPIFYDVNPSDVSCEGESDNPSEYKKVLFCKFQETHDPKKLQEWMSALSRVAQLADPLREGLHRKTENQFEYERIQQIVKWVTQNVPRYSVFFSFRGSDTRHPFIDFLHDAFPSDRFKINMHDQESENMDQISQSLTETIQNSWLSVVVFSENYASSSACLDELVTVLECKKRKNQLVWPIFFKMEPSELRHPINSYAKAMDEHANNFGEVKVKEWRSALFEAANIKGSHFKTGFEYEIIQKIVKGAMEAMYIRSP